MTHTSTAAGRERMVRLIPPPAVPVDARGDWRAVEAGLGVRLPDDYKWLVETYGWGEFCDLLYLQTPFGTNAHNGIAWQTAHGPDPVDVDPDRYPYPLHPEPGGLLVWGTTMDADRLCWRTGGPAGEWPVVVWSSEGWYETQPMGAAEFLTGWAAGEVASRLLGGMPPGLAPWFNTFRPRTHRCLVLSEGPLVHDERLRVLRGALAPTADRGSWRSERDGSGQDHFATVGADWQLTYDTDRPHQIRIDFPPEDSGAVRQRLFAAVERMGCRVLEVTTAAGTGLATWDTPTDEDEDDERPVG
ncbi:SMI1/KNR4 family protein [Streptomyces xanthophaeus]|uniref:SMI1/KNR4 family protein n=1 Tax=Streptomyces xanthophaeus TaxID=67385 RepID=UPI0036AF644D